MIVVLTGSSGRLGRRVQALLTAAGHELRPLRLRAGDAEAQVAAAIAGAGAVVHLGGISSAEASAVECETANVLPVKLLLAAATAAAVPRVLLASSGLVYGSHGATPRRETDPLAPAGDYAKSKRDAEEWVEAWAGRGDACGEVLRFANVYGPDSSPDTAVGRALEQARAGATIALRDPRPVRDLIWIDDAAEAIVRLLAADPGPGFHRVNIGTGRGTTIGAMASVLGVAAGVSFTPAAETPAGEPTSLVLDVTRLRARVGWTPPTPLAEGLRKALAAAA